MYKSGVDRFVGPYECQQCGLQVRLSTAVKLGRCTHECRRCGEESEHALTDEPVPESEAENYV